MIDYVKRMIEDADRRNIVVYDQHSSILSKRLISILITVWMRNGFVNSPTKIIVGEMAKADIETMFFSRVAINYQDIFIFGHKVEFVDGIDVDDDNKEYMEFFRSLDGSLPPMKSSIVLLCNEEECLMGAY